MEKQDSLQS